MPVRTCARCTVLHEPPSITSGTTCRGCGKPWPCAELQTIHRLVKDPEGEYVRLVRIADDRD